MSSVPASDALHSILLEKRLSPEPLTTYPVCTVGRLACPPEDCGGIPGYYDLLDALADSSHPQHRELCDWIGGEFNPESFSVEETNRLLSPGTRSRKGSRR